MTNIKLKAIEVYHPENVVGNDFFLEIFDKQGKDIRGLLETCGRNKRYIIDNEYENTLTMGIEASKRVLQTADLEGKDIDMIIFSSQFPEYTMPSQALIVQHAINGKEDTMCLDSNVNCVGLLVSLETTARAMLGNPYVKRALLIGSDYASIHCRHDDELTFANFGDGAVALILEKVEDDIQYGYIDSMCKSDGTTWELVKYPACGMSQLHNEYISKNDKYINWTPFNGMFSVDEAVKSIHTLLDRNNFKIDDIDFYCFSQFVKGFCDKGANDLGQSIDKFIYIGDKYGYTGTSSPFIALYEGIKSGQIKRGDMICLWSVGIHWSICTVLFRY
ncbi:MAG: 3-oxoacyl-ACP synthase [Clostridiaceae bacterium]|nr:3-oxoacyl-ACP synthase [Clostridiaceae bacterium]